MEILLENFSCYLERATIGGSSLYSRGTEADEGTGGVVFQVWRGGELPVLFN